ncbi:HAMP domain-containing sensor histidine kinase [Mucilaginibacter sp.]|uniref:sensor histidine kinase n=1 Tax=Mucilaginibacter sp. TaxID=1882438 RepID=UPI002ED433FE
MPKSTRFVIVVCAIAIAMVLLLQFYWVKNYYAVNQATFEKEVNMAFEDALKKEFSLRCDTIQQLIAKRLMDTTEFRITSLFDTIQGKHIFTIANAHKPGQKFSSSALSFRGVNKALMPGDTAFKWTIARRFAYTLRTEDLQNHVVYYRTQNLGGFMVDNVNKYDFDTTRLRPVLIHYLKDRNIDIPFHFYLREADSTMNRSHFSEKLLSHYPIVTKAYPTYKQSGKEQYVRAMFSNPFSYIVGRMGLMFAGSLLLIALVAFSLIYLLHTLFREKRLSAIKNDFISNITHEFKTPIATASAAIEALTGFGVLDDPEKARRYLSHSKSELEKLAGLVDKVLSISMYESLDFNIKPEPIDIDAKINELLTCTVALSGKEINWDYINNTGINTIMADDLYFEHAVNNIVDNALKYSGGKVQLQVSVDIKSDFLILMIKDNGIGIAAADLPMVFEKFYRVPSGNLHKVKGHGLGLNYVKSIVERHKGWCKIESEPGKGTIFSLAWPL